MVLVYCNGFCDGLLMMEVVVALVVVVVFFFLLAVGCDYHGDGG